MHKYGAGVSHNIVRVNGESSLHFVKKKGKMDAKR